jgi:fatty-acyl-CoA synthase
MELENHLLTHPSVVEAVVVAVPDDRWQERPLAAAVLRSGAATSALELRDFLVDKVTHWWLPERWTLVSQITRTGVGKLDKQLVRAERRRPVGGLELPSRSTESSRHG